MGDSSILDPTEGDFTKFNAAIIVLVGLLEKAGPGALDKAVESAKRKIPDYMRTFKITNGFRFLVFANDLLKWQPEKKAGLDVEDFVPSPMNEIGNQTHSKHGSILARAP